MEENLMEEAPVDSEAPFDSSSLVDKNILTLAVPTFMDVWRTRRCV